MCVHRAWEAAGFSKRRPEPPAQAGPGTSTPPKACCRLTVHSPASWERLAQVPGRAVWGGGLRGRSLVSSRAGPINPGDGVEGRAGPGGRYWGLGGARRG